MSLINRDIIKLIEDFRCGCGEVLKRKFTEEYEVNAHDKKLVVNGSCGPGSKVKIFWTIFDDDFDKGYIFTLPSFDSHDIFMTGIVHIPQPIGCEKSNCDPEWIYLDRLLSLPEVIRVEVYET